MELTLLGIVSVMFPLLKLFRLEVCHYHDIVGTRHDSPPCSPELTFLNQFDALTVKRLLRCCSGTACNFNKTKNLDTVTMHHPSTRCVE